MDTRAAAAAAVDDYPVLKEDDRGVPRALHLFAAAVEAESRRHAAAASRPAKSDLVKAFRGGTTPSVPIGEFLERIHQFIKLEDVRHVVEIQSTCYVLAAIYLTRFNRSSAAREARIRVEPSTAHRLVSAALFLGAKYGGANTLPSRWTGVFETSADGAIRAREITALEWLFVLAVDWNLHVRGQVFESFCRVLEKQPLAEERRTCSGGMKRKSTKQEDEDLRRRVRPCLPPPVVVSN